MYRAILSRDPKVGTFAEQRAAFSEGVDDRIVEFLPDEVEALLFRGGLREGDVLLMAHARVFGRVKQRERYLDLCAQLGAYIQLPGGEPVMYDTPEKKAEFHIEARKPTGRPSDKQKKMRGRPRKYPEPSPENKHILMGWWHNVLPKTGKRMPLRDVLANAKELLGHPVTRDFMKNLCGKTRGKPYDD